MIFDVKNDMYKSLGRSVQNFRPLGALEVSNSYNGIVRDGGTFCVLSRVASQLKIKGSLAKHHKEVHVGLTYRCKHCSYKATLKGSLEEHQKSVYEGN